MKKRLDRKQIHEVGFVVNRFIEALEREIEISHPDSSETFSSRVRAASTASTSNMYIP